MAQKRLLITGMSGFLGYHLAKIAQSNWQVYGTYLAHPLEEGLGISIRLDLTDLRMLKELFATVKPDAVIHTAAQSKPNICQNYPEEAYKINVTASLSIASLCSDLVIPCVFTSTDLVFDGQDAPYKEADPVSPISYYGEQKVKAEEGLQKIYPKTAICRMPLMFGKATPSASSFMQPFLQTLREGKPLSLFSDEYRTPVSATAAAKGLLLALEKVQGIIHLGGKESLSRYEFGLLMAQAFHLPATNIRSCLRSEVPMSAPRPADVSLDSSKAFALGYQPLAIAEELQLIAQNI
jgi:dTDP-4-dehydrorhamnose reductase